MKKTLFIYHLKDIDHYQSIIHILPLMNIQLYEIEDDMIHLKIKDILNHKIKKRKNKSLEMPFILFSGFDSESIDLLLKVFKNGNIPFIPLKAMVTATNLNWSFEYLYFHVYEEYKNVVKNQSKS
ncbi:MAG: DUF3783 domain-containing protein [Faecalibacillus sp.]